MVVLGVLLIAAAAAFGADFALTNNHHVPDPTVFGISLGVGTDYEVFLIGAVAGAVAMLGLALMTGGAAGGMRRRRLARRDEEMAALAAERDRVVGERDGLAAERDRLLARHEERRDVVGTTAAAPAVDLREAREVRDGELAAEHHAADAPATGARRI
jgi:hypothetical protein